MTVDDHLTVTGVAGDWLYAIGDLCGRALLTHMGKYQARIAGNVIAARAAGRWLGDAPFTPYADVAELTHSATMAVVARIPGPVLWHAVPSYPTVSEAWLRLLETLNAARHT